MAGPSSAPSDLRSVPKAPTIPDRLRAAHAEQRPLLSFEFMPPRNPDEDARLWQTLRDLERLRPDYVSVTYHADGSTRDRTVRTTEAIARHTTLHTMAHLTCVGQSTAQVRQVVGAYADAGINHVLAVRGDMPGGPTEPWRAHPDGLANATELVELVSGLGDFTVGVAAFPDVHPERRDPDLDARLLAEKARAGATFAITQLFFDVERYTQMIDRVRSLGCDIPIIAGIMPVTTLRGLQRMTQMSGQEVPEWVLRRLSASEDPARVRAAGMELCRELAERLIEVGAPGIQFFTMNRARASRELFAALRVS